VREVAHMAAIKFEEEHEARGWSFILRHADDAYIRRDHVVLVDAVFLRKLKRAGIPFQVVNGEVPVDQEKNQKNKKAVRSKK